MLKKVLKAVAKLNARATTAGAASLDAGSSLTKKLRSAIADLDARAKNHDVAADLARDAARRLRLLLAVEATKVAAPKPASVKPAAKAKPAKLPRAVKPTPKAAPKAGPIKNAISSPTPASTATTAKSKPPTKSVTKSKTAPTLADAIQHVLKSRQDQNAGAVKARQLHSEVQQAGYRFGGNNIENQLNYLHKTLRQHATRFKRAADGTIALA